MTEWIVKLRIWRDDGSGTDIIRTVRVEAGTKGIALHRANQVIRDMGYKECYTACLGIEKKKGA